jgi:hypothetical protein
MEWILVRFGTNTKSHKVNVGLVHMNPIQHLLQVKIKLNFIYLLKSSSLHKEFVPDVNWIALCSTSFIWNYFGMEYI